MIPRPTPLTSRSCGPRRPSGENSPRVGTTRSARYHLGSKSSAGGRRGPGEVSARTAMIGIRFRVQRPRDDTSGGHCHRNLIPIVRKSFCPSEKLVRELAGDRTHHRPSPRLPMHEPFGQRSLRHVNNSDPGRRGATWRLAGALAQQSGASATGSARFRDIKLFSEVEGLHE